MKRSGRRRVWIGWGAGAILLGAVAAYVAGRPAAGAADPNDRTQVRHGQAVYAAHCAACHGSRLEGQPSWQSRRADGKLPAPPHDETGHTWHHPDQQLFELTKHGIASVAGPRYATDMPAFAGRLSDAEIWAVLAFIKSEWPREIQLRQERLNRRRD